MKIGTVIVNDTGNHVVTETTNGYVTKTEPLEQFISRSVIVEYKGECKTLREIIEIHCDEYLSKCTIIEEQQQQKTKKSYDNFA
ncbi:hypothetical protein JK635_02470 [Neobacillus sp. YIM B02564]|uniref:DUF2187 domain-containing protein n=1 Tax=Neobacillus paridis TaxID=2803862 RepID=A0ABS1TMH3_9BACI|nr:hypothetical protein [Neobacillus paridis]MBL4951105.1 hypothetical protein [Neobacillus paridis]